MHLSKLALVAVLILTPILARAEEGGYKLQNLVANKQIYGAPIIDKNMVNAWGMAIRPAGAGGHFWINNTDTGTVSLYVGDVGNNKLFQDDVALITIAAVKGSKEHSAPTGEVFNGNPNEFIVTEQGITAGSKFIFCSEDGGISGWTERKNADGTFSRPTTSTLMIDRSKQGAIYKGIALSSRKENNYLYAADFANKRIDVFNAQWKPVKLEKTAFRVPSQQIPVNYAPFNIENFGGKLYVAYAKLTKVPGEEEKGVGFGYVAEFDFDGNLLRVLESKGKLNAPWGMAVAPDNFGPASNKLLVGNFGDGRIVAFDLGTGKQGEYLQTAQGEPVEIDGLWDLIFGNGESLGESNHLYFSAGPNDEKDGVFGKLVWDKKSLLN